MKKLLAGLSIALLPVLGLATDIANVPIEIQNAAKPNIIFGLDDSGSMDSEVLLNTNDGALWWNSDQQSYLDDNDNPLFNANGVAGGSWYKYVYLLPNGSANDARIYTDQDNDHFAIAPIPSNAYLRSSDYNPLYYNPSLNYIPWQPAYLNGVTRTFAAVSATTAPSHPAIAGETNINLTANLTTTNTNWTFRMLPGMTIPGNLSSGIRGRKLNSSQWQNITKSYTIPKNEQWDVVIPYYPATYYLKDPSCTSSDLLACPRTPDGKSRLRRYEIKRANFSSDSSYQKALQNFANWFSYYRKRKLMLGAAMGQVLSQVNNLRGGVVNFNSLNTVTMYDFNSVSDSQNWRALLGKVYLNPANGGTPTRDALNYIGQQYMNNGNIVQNACQINAAMILTDGYANVSKPSVPDYNEVLYGKGSPYTITYPYSLADLALAYYSINLQRGFPTGLVPIDLNNSQPNADKNPNLHLNTYGMTLGTKGTIFGNNALVTQNPYVYPPSWPNPTQDRNPSAVDDLWHATINGRGLMLNTSDPPSVVAAIQQLINAVLVKASAGAAIGINPVTISADSNIAYASSYNGNYGELIPLLVDINTGAVNIDPEGWSARDLLNTRTPASRLIATYNGSIGVPLQWASLPTSMQAMLNSNVSPPGPSDGQTMLNWLRGDQSLEGTSYRSRSYLLGDIVYAEPVVVRGGMANYIDTGYGSFKQSLASRTPIIYQGANDGMLHAFNANTGQEAWAYIPRLNFDQLDKLADKSYSHRFYVDGTPVVNDINGNNCWMTLLVGGLRAGGNGYYALDITNPDVSSEGNLKNKVKWEFPNLATPSAMQNNMGLSFGKPIIAKTKANGWVVLVTSGYNNNAGDGRGHLFVLNPNDGSVIKDLVTSSGSASNPSGLSQISAFAANKDFDATIDYVYGGDLNGNLWRFDLASTKIADWNVKLLAQLVNSQGQPQPITTAPELGFVNNRRMVYVGTGQMLGNSDIYTTQQQSMYGLVDGDSAIAPLRTNLVQRLVTNGTNITGNSVDYNSKRGWFIDFPQTAERVNTDPILAFGVLTFTTNLPSPIACSAKSYLYAVSALDGVQLPPSSSSQTVPPARQFIGGFLTTKPVVVILPNGKAVALTHNSDNTVLTLNIPTDLIRNAQKIAWKEVLRE
jgi:type IV pilus assembly protein PilY1